MTESRATVAARLALGLIFAVFGLNGFLNFLPMPPPEGAAAAFVGALAAERLHVPVGEGHRAAGGPLVAERPSTGVGAAAVGADRGQHRRVPRLSGADGLGARP